MNETEKQELRRDRDKCGLEQYFKEVIVNREKGGKPKLEQRAYVRANSFSQRRNEIQMRDAGFVKEFITLDGNKTGYYWTRS